MPPKKGNKTFTTDDTAAQDVQDISAPVIDSASASEPVSPKKNPAPQPPPGNKETLKRKPADAPRSRSLESKSKEAQKTEAQLKAEAKARLQKIKKQKAEQEAYLAQQAKRRQRQEEAKKAAASDSSASGWSTSEPVWSPQPKSSSYPSTPTSKQPWNNPNRRTPDQLQKAKDLEKLQEAALVTHKRKQEEAERLRICLLYTSPSPRDGLLSRMPSSA